VTADGSLKPWDEFEALVLQWVFDHTGEDSGLLPHQSVEPFAGIPSLTEPQFTEAVGRLIQQGLIAARGEPVHTIGYTGWAGLRPTANGLRVRGQWPPNEGTSVNSALAHILRQLAAVDGVPDEDRSAARRAAATVTNLSGDVVLDVMRAEIARLIGGSS
jgi:hypothetical protein